jgi:hypothetical protein
MRTLTSFSTGGECRNLNLGLAKVHAKIETWESHFMVPGVWESVRE